MQTELFTFEEQDEMVAEIDRKQNKKTREEEIREFHEHAEENRLYRKSLKRRVIK